MDHTILPFIVTAVVGDMMPSCDIPKNEKRIMEIAAIAWDVTPSFGHPTFLFFYAAIVGDITPSCGIPKEEKRRMETAAMDEMCAMLGPLGKPREEQAGE